MACYHFYVRKEEDCRPRATSSSDTPLSGKLFLVETPQGCHISILNMKSTTPYVDPHSCIAKISLVIESR